MFNNFLIRVLNRNLSKKLFTLVELIVVIVILAVLAAISFMMVTKWINKSSNARAASDVGTITRALHGHYSEKGIYPETSKPIGMLSATGLLLGEQGVFDEEVIKSLGTFSKLPKDPKANDYYMYTVIKNPSKGFEVGAVFENPEISVLGTKVYADGAGNAIPYVQSTYHGKYYAADGVTPIFPKPLSVFDQTNGKYLQESTIGVSGDLVIDLALLTGKQLTSFSADGVMIGGEYGDYIMPKVGYTASGAVGSFSTGVIMQALPQSVTSVTTSSSSSSSVVSNSCASQPSIPNATFTTGTPNSVNQSWTYALTPGNCTWNCNNGYQKGAGDACNIIVGTCGTTNNTIQSTTPITNLCGTGVASSVSYSTGMGQYTRTCSAGTVANCKAIDHYTKLLLHFNGLDNSTTFTDVIGKSIVRNGNPFIKTGTNQQILGNGSSYFDGVGDYLRIANNDDWDLGGGDFTIDTWVNIPGLPTGDGYAIVGRLPANNIGWGFLIRGATYGSNPTLGLSCNGAWQGITTSYLSYNQWTHIAIVQSSLVTKIYINGVQSGTTGTCPVGGNNDLDLIVGEMYPNNIGTRSWYMKGYIDELRISKGIARRKANFTPPTIEY